MWEKIPIIHVSESELHQWHVKRLKKSIKQDKDCSKNNGKWNLWNNKDFYIYRNLFGFFPSSIKAYIYSVYTFPRIGAIPMITEAKADRTCWEESDDSSWNETCFEAHNYEK